MTEVKKVFDKQLTPEGVFLSYESPTRRRAAEEGIPYHLDIELLDRCTGGCLYCFQGSTPQGTRLIPRERLFKLLDEATSLGTRQVLWQGGEPLYYPWLFEASDYAAEKGVRCAFFTSGIPLTPKMCRQIVRQPNLQQVSININTVSPENFARQHNSPKVLQAKVHGYRNLLEAGFPPGRIFPSVCLTRVSAETVAETIDWFVEEMKAPFVFLFPFVPWGFGRDHPEWEPSLEQVRRAYEYRARKTSPLWNQIGSIDCPTTHCRIKCYIFSDGTVLPCNFCTNMVAGNIYEESFVDIHERHRDMLHFKTLHVKGKCGNCEYNDHCFGCRGKAWNYLGDVEASDPKCWRNPEAPQHVWEMKRGVVTPDLPGR